MSDRSKYMLHLAATKALCWKTGDREIIEKPIQQTGLSSNNKDNGQSSLTNTDLIQDCLFQEELELLEENIMLRPDYNLQSVDISEINNYCQEMSEIHEIQDIGSGIQSNEIEKEYTQTENNKDKIDDPLWNFEESESTSDSHLESENEIEESNVVNDLQGEIHANTEPANSEVNQLLNNNDDQAEMSEEFKENKRKRQCNPAKWVRNVRKKKFNSGISHINSRNKKVEKRKILGSCKQSCKFQCGTKISDDNRKIIFKRYWEIGDLHKQRSYILKQLTAIPHTRTLENNQLRKNNNAFYFEVDSQRIRVCKEFFVKTLGISDRMVRTVIEKTTDGILENDRRGKHGHQMKVSDEIKIGIRDHINSIPRIDSHYLRAQISREFIDGGKTLADIYRDYKTICMGADKSYGNYTMFSRIFRNEFNISFFHPKKDQCGMCEEYKNANDKAYLQENYDRHVKEKDLSRAEKDKDKQASKEFGCIAVCFDLQAVLQTPCGDINTFYYKSKLSTYNFTIFDLGLLNGFCYVWHEGEGNRGSNEIGSCLYSFLENECSKGIPVVLYCDNCYGQNKNKFITSLLLYTASKLNIPSIALKFLVVGHTQNEGDNMHSLIEKQKKRVLRSGPIYTPSQWIPVISNAKKTGTPYKIKEMNFTDFFDIKHLQEQMGQNFVLNTEGEKVLWSAIVMLKVFKNELFAVYYKTSYSDNNFKKILIRKTTSRNSTSLADDVELKQLYDAPLEVAQNKLDALSFLCKKNHIILKYHDFYRSLGCKIDPPATIHKKKTQQSSKKGTRKQKGL